MFTVRPATEDDMKLVYSAWSQSYVDAPAVRGMERSAYFPWMFEKIRRLTDDPACEIRVACAESDPDVILGFAVYNSEHNALHYVYTRGGENTARGLGVARACVGDWTVACYTFRSRTLRQTPAGWKFRPDLAGF